jgi:replicative DNA helicase
MSLDLTTLRLLRKRKHYERIAGAVPQRGMDVRTKIVLDDMGRFFREFPDVQECPAEGFTIFFHSIHPKLAEDEVAVYQQLLRLAFKEEEDEGLLDGLLARLYQVDASTRMLDVIEKFNQGGEIDLIQGIGAIQDNYNAIVQRKVKNPQVLDRIEDLLLAEQNETGMAWRLACLREFIKPVVPGDFIVVAARPDKGKTTWCASELTHMAAQLDTIWPNEGREIMWLNNEGPGRRIVTRTFQAALNYTTEQLIEQSAKGVLRDQYRAALGGRGGALRIYDIHGWTNVQVEDLIKSRRPALVLFDMIDNINFVGMASNNGQRTDQLLEAQYQWARVLGVKYDCATMATSQISADGDGLQFPTLPMLKDSKTGKQGAADVIITLGTVNDPMLIKSRYIGCTKNKKVRTGKGQSPMTEVLFDGDRGRFVEITA